MHQVLKLLETTFKIVTFRLGALRYQKKHPTANSGMSSQCETTLALTYIQEFCRRSSESITGMKSLSSFALSGFFFFGKLKTVDSTALN